MVLGAESAARALICNRCFTHSPPLPRGLSQQILAEILPLIARL